MNETKSIRLRPGEQVFRSFQPFRPRKGEDTPCCLAANFKSLAIFQRSAPKAKASKRKVPEKLIALNVIADEARLNWGVALRLYKSGIIPKPDSIASAMPQWKSSKVANITALLCEEAKKLQKQKA